MATVQIGERSVALPVMSVRVMRVVLPLVNALEKAATGGEAGDLVNTDAMIGLTMDVVAAWLNPPPPWEDPEAEDLIPLSKEKQASWIAREAMKLSEEMTVAQINGVGPIIREALMDMGMTTTGESLVGGPVAPARSRSTRGSTRSSANSSPQASKAAAGAG